MRRFPSGTTDQYIYFVAVDSTDLKTRETGLSSFTVYRARNGAAAAAYTTPTIAEVSSANMPGVYSLLLDEDMTIASGNKSEEVVLHITQASMAPVTLVYELYRPDVTEGETITVSSGAVSTVTTTTTATNVTTVNGLAANVITAAATAADFGTEVGTAVWATATRVLTANTNLNDPTAAAIADAVWDEAQADHVGVGSFGVTASEIADILVDTAEIGAAGAGLTALASAANLATVAGYIDTEIAAIKAKTDNLPADPADASDIAARFTTLDTAVGDLPTNAELATALGTADDAVLAQVALVKAKTDLIPAAPAAVGDIPTAAVIADAVWDEATAGHTTAGTTGKALTDAGSAGDPWATVLPGAYGAGTAGKLVGDNINAPIATVDTVVDAIKAKTDSLTFTVAGQVDANIQYVNDVQVNGTGAPGSEWGP